MVVSRFEDPDYVARVGEYLGKKVILHCGSEEETRNLRGI